MGADQSGEVRSRTVSQVVRSPAATVYEYAADPDRLPLWAAGLVNGTLSREGDALVLDGPAGRVTIRFVPRNDLGVLDHDVTLPDGVTTSNPFRVLTHPDGSELLFTVRQVGLSDDEFERDVQAVREDLLRLKNLVEERA